MHVCTIGLRFIYLHLKIGHRHFMSNLKFWVCKSWHLFVCIVQALNHNSRPGFYLAATFCLWKYVFHVWVLRTNSESDGSASRGFWHSCSQAQFRLSSWEEIYCYYWTLFPMQCTKEMEGCLHVASYPVCTKSVFLKHRVQGINQLLLHIEFLKLHKLLQMQYLITFELLFKFRIENYSLSVWCKNQCGHNVHHESENDGEKF